MKPVHELCPTTRRPGFLVARMHGQSVRKTAASLPENANVVDFGAGRSGFGKAVARRRPDITWYNVDLRYGHQRGIPRRQRRSPENVQYVAADVLSPPFALRSVHRVYSTALWPHLNVTSSDVAVEAFKRGGDLLTENGEISISGFRPIPFAKTFHATAEQYQTDPEGVATAAVDMMRLNRFLNETTRLSALGRHAVQGVTNAVSKLVK